MSTAAFVHSRRAFTRRPAVIAEAAIAAGWVAVVAAPAAGMPAMTAVDGQALTMWVAMTAAMMLPSALPVARHVAVNSLRRRRHRAVALFVAGYLAVWGTFGLGVLALLTALPVIDPGLLALAAVLIAAGWQLTPIKPLALRACHRTMPLPAGGARADAAALRFGLRNGAACVGSCWALMSVMSCVPGPTVVWGAAIGAGAFIEKTSAQPRYVAWMGALVLGLVALLASVPLLGR